MEFGNIRLNTNLISDSYIVHTLQWKWCYSNTNCPVSNSWLLAYNALYYNTSDDVRIAFSFLVIRVNSAACKNCVEL